MDEPFPFARHAPGSAASEWASFNLGEATFGVGTLTSVLPIVLILFVTAIFILRKARTIDEQSA
jgi:hypothetical protein